MKDNFRNAEFPREYRYMNKLLFKIEKFFNVFILGPKEKFKELKRRLNEKYKPLFKKRMVFKSLIHLVLLFYMRELENEYI